MFPEHDHGHATQRRGQRGDRDRRRGAGVPPWVARPTQQGFVALAVLATAGALAVWKRPAVRDATGRRLRPTTVVNAVLAIGIVAIPIGIAGVGR
jgi:hypothetical protein